MNKEISKKLQSLVRLISFFKQIRHRDTLEKLGFFFVNDLYNIIPFRQCILWRHNGRRIELFAASGQVDIDESGPLAQFVIGTVQRHLLSQNVARDADARSEYVEENGYAYILNSDEELQNFDSSRSEISEFLAPHTIHTFLLDSKGVIGGIWLARDEKLGDMGRAVLEDAGDALASQMLFFTGDSNRFSGGKAVWTKLRAGLLVVFIVFCLWPVRHSVTTSAEIVSKDSYAITIPFDGLIDSIEVEPNEVVQEGAVLFSLDKTRLQNEHALSLQSLETAKKKLSKTEREVFADSTKISELNFLKEDVKLKKLEVSYAKDRLDLSDVKAEESGIVFFSDKNDLKGKPARAGDIIMTIADPRDMELMITIPVDSMIDVRVDVPVRFFLNILPLNSYAARLYNVSYKPSLGADGLLTYKARAHIEKNEDIKKIGLTGTAKIYGGWTIMILNILRRPFIAFRNVISL